MGRSGRTGRKELRYELLRIIFQLYAAWDHHRDHDCSGSSGERTKAQQGKEQAETATRSVYREHEGGQKMKKFELTGETKL